MPPPSGNPEVKDRDIGLRDRYAHQRVRHGARFAHHVDVSATIEQDTQPRGHDLVVVEQKHTETHGHHLPFRPEFCERYAGPPGPEVGAPRLAKLAVVLDLVVHCESRWAWILEAGRPARPSCDLEGANQ
jgi:hypothetical protein